MLCRCSFLRFPGSGQPFSCHFERSREIFSVIPRLRPWNLSSVTAAPESLRLRRGLERAKTERHRGLDEPTSPFTSRRLVTSADNARHAASRHRPLHRARAQFRFRSRARTAAATGRRSAPSLLICGERRSKNAAKLLPLSSQNGIEGAGGARRRTQARKPKLSKKAA